MLRGLARRLRPRSPSRGRCGILALPRDPSLYQETLYEALEPYGYDVEYIGELTPSHTLNVILIPFELIARRVAGWRILHLHWVFAFQLPGGPTTRGLAEAWFGLVLAVARRLRMPVVWTAHNVLPHAPVFADDQRARRRLVRDADLVLAHSQATLDGLREFGAVPRAAAIMPLGSFKATADDVRPPTRRPGSPLRLLFFGRVAEYKGVEELIAAIRRVPTEAAVELVVAGGCSDLDLRRRLVAAGEEEPRVDLRLEFVPDAELSRLLAWCQLAVLPFRTIATSSSVALAWEHGRAVIVPDLPAFADVPDGAVVRYDGTVGDLARLLVEVVAWDEARFADLGAAAQGQAPPGWGAVAEEMDRALKGADLTRGPDLQPEGHDQG